MGYVDPVGFLSGILNNIISVAICLGLMENFHKTTGRKGQHKTLKKEIRTQNYKCYPSPFALKFLRTLKIKFQNGVIYADLLVNFQQFSGVTSQNHHSWFSALRYLPSAQDSQEFMSVTLPLKMSRIASKILWSP